MTTYLTTKVDPVLSDLIDDYFQSSYGQRNFLVIQQNTIAPATDFALLGRSPIGRVITQTNSKE